MEDKAIVELYWQRSERAISETAKKYGGYCYTIAYNVLASREDAEESVNDTYLAAWNRLPPNRPSVLGVFLGRIARNISISRWRSRSAAKRGGGEILLALEELTECASEGQDPEAAYLRRETTALLNAFLDSLAKDERNVFLRRYWSLDPIARIAQDMGFSQSKVKSMLHRSRGKLRAMLEKEAYV